MLIMLVRMRVLNSFVHFSSYVTNTFLFFLTVSIYSCEALYNIIVCDDVIHWSLHLYQGAHLFVTKMWLRSSDLKSLSGKSQHKIGTICFFWFKKKPQIQISCTKINSSCTSYAVSCGFWTYAFLFVFAFSSNIQICCSRLIQW